MPWSQVPTYHEQINTNTATCSKCGHVTLTKLNIMLNLGYELFVLHVPHSICTYQAVNPNNIVSYPGRYESPAIPLS